MTLPIERFRAIRHARDFLRSLLDAKKTPRVPMKTRMDARSVLKHFPADHEMEAAQKKLPNIFGSKDEG